MKMLAIMMVVVLNPAAYDVGDGEEVVVVIMFMFIQFAVFVHMTIA